MDTVYLRGMLEDQPFCIDGERAYGLAIADDKQGVVLILHTAAMLQWLPSPKSTERATPRWRQSEQRKNACF
jgi:acetylornithine deacetylase/succinyl-diaminopimelate desuccinylase-like protein